MPVKVHVTVNDAVNENVAVTVDVNEPIRISNHLEQREQALVTGRESPLGLGAAGPTRLGPMFTVAPRASALAQYV